METLRLFWIWWRDQLLELLPGHAERRQRGASDGLILAEPALGADAGPGADPRQGGSVLIGERRHGVETPPTRVALDREATEGARASAARSRLPIVLRLPGAMLLEREVFLPSAAERDLGRVLFHELDRFTPFAADEVVWTYATRFRDRAHARIGVRLSLVMRAAVEPAIEALAAAGLNVAWLELAAADGERRRIPLTETSEAGERAGLLLRPALAGIGVLFLAAVASPFFLQGIARGEVEQRIARDAPIVAKVQALRGAATAGATGTEVIAAERRQAGDALEAIALLTDALPDDTYLTGLTYEAGKLTLDGQSKSAAALIAPLTANPRLRDASFTAPVVRNTLGLDSFSLQVRVNR